MPPSLLLRSRRPLLPITLGISLSAILLSSPLQRHPLLCDTLPSSLSSSSTSTATPSAQVPIIKRGRLNPAAIRQISAGSILGFISGVAVSTFSKTLAVLFGLVVCGIQFAASKGYNIVPTTRLQRYIKGINLRSAVEDNAAFKLSFGVTSMLAAFAKF